MPAPELAIHIPLRKLLIGLSMTVVPLSILGLHTITRAENELRQTVGRSFHTIAESTASRISAVVHDRVLQVAAVARGPAIVDAVTAANRGWAGVGEAAFRERISHVENIWNTPQSESLIRGILSSTASRALQQQLRLDPRYLRITLTDERGATIASTHKTLDYYQADEDFWQAIHAQGRGAVNLTDILYDEVTKANYVGIGVPVVEPDTNRFIGAVDALMDLSSLLPASQTFHPGSSARTLLVKDDGTVISGPGVTLSMARKSEEMNAVQETIQSAIRPGGYVLATLPGGTNTLIGFADTGLRADYRNLGWLVLVAQDAREAFASIRGVVRLIFLLAAFGLTAIILLAAYFSLHRKVRYEDIAGAIEDKPEVKSSSAAV